MRVSQAVVSLSHEPQLTDDADRFAHVPDVQERQDLWSRTRSIRSIGWWVEHLVVRGNTRTSEYSASAPVAAGRDGIVLGPCAGAGMGGWWSRLVRPIVVARAGDPALRESA